MPDTLDRASTPGEETTRLSTEAPLPPPRAFGAGDRIADRYRLERPLGRGGGGEVWEAHDQIAGTPVAVKILQPAHPLELARARKEILALRILRVPGVVRLLDDGVEDGLLFLVMERVYGTPFPGKGRRGSWEAIAEVAVALLETLARIHAEGIIHRDLKPENVLVNDEGRPTVLDFGISVGDRLGQRITEQGGLVGTLAYLAPEQLRSEEATVQTDLYAFGLLLYEALTGQLPHDAQDRMAFLQARHSQQVPPLKSRAPGVPTEIAGLIDLLLSRQPERRPRSAAEVLGILQGQPTPALTAPMLPRLDGREPVDRVLRAVREGRSVDVVGARHTGRTRCLQDVAEALRKEGFRVEWATQGVRPFASLERVLRGLGERVSSLSEMTQAVDDRLREELSGGMVLVIDDAERLDQRSAEALARCGSAGVLVRALLEEQPEGGAELVRLEPLSKESLEPLFAGPERVFHLRSDAARILWMRTEGLQARVAEELTAWIRAGIARWDGKKLTVDRESLDSLEGGMRVLPLDRSAPFDVPGEVPLPAHLQELAAWIAVASSLSDLSGIATAMGQELWETEAGLLDLQERGRARRLPDGRVELRGWSNVAQGLSAERRRKMHRMIAMALPEGAQGRLLHLIQGSGDEDASSTDALEIGKEAEVRARRLTQGGRLGQAVAVLKQGLLVIRRSASSSAEQSSLEERLLSSWTHVALLLRTPEAYARVLYELSRSESPTAEMEHLAELVRAAEACTVGRNRSLKLLNEMKPFANIDLERQRQWLRVLAARRCAPDVEETVLKEIENWARQTGDTITHAQHLGWLGSFQYRQGSFMEAARLHSNAAQQEPWVVERIADQLNAASAFMVAFQHGAAEFWAEFAQRQARECRHVFYEIQAQLILRSVAYRLDEAKDPDLELLDVVAQIGTPDIKAAVCVTEAAVAYRAGDMRLAADLASKAGDIYNQTPMEGFGLLGRCLALAAGAKPQDEDVVDRLVEEALKAEVPGIGIQALGLLARAGVVPWRPWAQEQSALTEGIPRSCWHLRMAVLSVDEALESLSDIRAVGRPQRGLKGTKSPRRQGLPPEEESVPPFCLRAWFRDHPEEPIDLPLGVPAQLRVDIGLPSGRSIPDHGKLPDDAGNTIHNFDGIDIAIICPGARILPLRQRLNTASQSTCSLTWNITPHRAGRIHIQIVVLLQNEPVHRAHLTVYSAEQRATSLRKPAPSGRLKTRRERP